MSYTDKLLHYFPGRRWYANGDTYEGIVWQDESGQPTKSDLDALEWPVATIADVVAERERRLALGFDYDFGDGRGVHHIGTTPDDMRKWMDEVTPLAQAFINAGQPSGEITIVTETGPVVVTAMEWQQILLAAASWRQPIYAASFALQAMDPIPSDFSDEGYWAAIE